MLEDLSQPTLSFIKKVLDCNFIDEISIVSNHKSSKIFKSSLTQAIATIHFKEDITAKILVDQNKDKIIFLVEKDLILKKNNVKNK